jgi:hypothetical protein
VAVSCAAIHNLYKPADRAQALIDDIRHGSEYAAHGCRDVRDVRSRAGAILTKLITMGSLRPAKLVVRKGISEEES